MRKAIVAASCLLATAAAAGSETLGGWTTTSEPDEGPATLVTALAAARGASQNDPSFIIVRCLGGRTEALVGTAGDWGLPRSSLEVATQSDSGARETSRWDVSTNGKAVFRSEGVEDFLRRLPAEGRLTIEVRDRAGDVHANAFSLEGFGDVRTRVAAACGWTP
ncbi:hypothetical protein [Methylopila sp. Yamaguchi]|uniref:hypothetical protein n=1 Tax=Methylopila sp. Yamaguchi TaxID=1437817 RepID=UPI000CBEA316|nr:hypothetical protein [Methylopila sp. Yamaguchi]GBD48197.1 hypothetical protein METY_1410 [Methylopila sp. Yamaguchi]